MSEKKQREAYLLRQKMEEQKFQEQFQKLIYELSNDEYNLQKRLAKRNLLREDMETELAETRKEFAALVMKYQLRIDNTALFVKDLYGQQENMTMEELLFCFVAVVCELDAENEGILMGPCIRNCEDTDTLDKYLTFRKRRCRLEKRIHRLAEMEGSFQKIISKKPKDMGSNVNDALVKELAELLECTFPDKESKREMINDNLYCMIRIVEVNEGIRKIAPVYFYRMITMHHARLGKQENFQPSFKNLWKYRSYSIEKDNKKNFKSFEKYMGVFRQCVEIGKKYYGKDIDMKLNKYLFTRLSNLSLWALDYGRFDSGLMLETIPVYLHRRRISIFRISPMQCDPCFLFQISEKKQVRWEQKNHYDHYFRISECFAAWMEEKTAGEEILLEKGGSGKDSASMNTGNTAEETMGFFEEAYAVSGENMKTLLIHTWQDMERCFGKEELCPGGSEEEQKFGMVTLFGEYARLADHLIEERLCRIGEKILDGQMSCSMENG